MKHAKPERSMLPYLLRRPAALALLALARSGAFTARPVLGAREFDADRVLKEVPGAPRAVVLPGHTPGSAAYFFADRGLLFTGDALVTVDGFTKRTGPTLREPLLHPRQRAALAALDRLDFLDGGPGAARPRRTLHRRRPGRHPTGPEFGIH
ncbi:MBL fold metallo-hydrolase [Streptomyces sp. L7]